MNAEKFTQKSLDAVRTAKSMAEENRNNYITPEHLLYALVDQDGGLIPSLLGKMKVDGNAVLSELDTAIAALPKVRERGVSLPGVRPRHQRRRKGREIHGR